MSARPLVPLAPDDYLRAALEIVGAHGSAALTITALAERLGVTKGSFYHHFAGMPAFVERLLVFWEAEHSEQLISASRAEADAALRVTGLVEVAVGLPHAPESALRAWGRSNPAVAAVVARVDGRREQHLIDAIADLGVPRPQAQLLGSMALSLLVGVQTRDQPVDPEHVRRTYEEFVRLVYLNADAEGAST